MSKESSEDVIILSGILFHLQVCNVLEAFIWFLHAFLDYYSCTLKCLLPSAGHLPNDVCVQNFVQAPPPSLSFWNCSKIRRECLKEREGKRKKAFAHTD